MSRSTAQVKVIKVANSLPAFKNSNAVNLLKIIILCISAFLGGCFFSWFKNLIHYSYSFFFAGSLFRTIIFRVTF